ncbi:MAG TPA: TonB-dependent receptor [Longimicrobiaceae bacterium]|nr:TonB-dependent receptor [Longimicrobiaceae bacterium]
MQPRWLGRFVLALAVAFGVLPRLHAQGATTGSIRGQVLTSEGQPVASAQVVATNNETGLRRTAVSGSDGRYSILLLPSGVYGVRAQGLGFAPATATVRVSTGEATTVDLRLASQAVTIEGITVSGERARVDVTQGGVASRVGAEQLENLPVAGRDFTDFLNLSPLVSPQPQVGTGGQFSIGGARTSGTNIQIDGADANNIFFGENRGSSRTPFTFSLESVREFQLITNGYDVEYGNYQGGVMNAVTKGGTNRFEGSAFYFRRDEALTGNDFFGRDPVDYVSQQFGLSASGPVIRNRLHFFLSADGQRRNQPFFAGDPGVAGLNADSLAQFFSILRTRYGVANPENYYGQFDQEQNNLALFGRLDWTINDNHRFTIRQNYSDFEQTNDRIGTREAFTSGGPFQDKVYSTVAELTSDFGGNAFNTLRFQYSDEVRPRPAREDGGYIPQLSVTLQTGQSISFGGDGVLFRNRLDERKLQLIDNFTVRRGAHTFKVGTNNILSSTDNTFWLNGNGSYSFTSLNNFRNGVVDRYTRSQRACPVELVANERGERVVCPQYDVPVAAFDVLEWSLYAQDEWQVTDRFLVTGGVRYGQTNFRDQPSQVPDVETSFGIPTGQVPDFSGISPRLSFTYNLGGGEQVIRGGVGYLIGRAPAVLAGNVFQTEKLFRQLTCTGAGTPSINVPEWLAAPQGQANPAACRTVGGALAPPEYAVFSEDFDLPRTTKANIGYEGVLPTGTRFVADVIFSDTRENFTVQDLNLNAPQFFLASEAGRPVFVATNRVNVRGATQANRARFTAYDRVYLNSSEGEARAWNLNLELEHRFGDRLQAGLRYGFNRAFDNGSFSCCTSFEGIGNAPTAGDLNYFGDPGDRQRGTWGPSDFERRHVIVGNFLFRAPFGFRINGIFRSQSGTPWTPTVDGDVNGDGLSANDRAMIDRNLQFTTAADRQKFEQLLEDFECLQDQAGGIAERNSCRNPWWNSLDVRISKELPTFGRQRAELLVDVFNVLNGLNEDWGRFVTVSGSATSIVRAERFDTSTGQVVYSTNYFPERDPGSRGFGEARPLSFGDPFQFQVQLGLRYRF